MTTTPKLIFTTLMTSIGVNLFIGEQFLSVILPGNAFKETYKKAGLDPTVLESYLRRWRDSHQLPYSLGIAGSFVAKTFGIPTMTYLPFVFSVCFLPSFRWSVPLLV